MLRIYGEALDTLCSFELYFVLFLCFILTETRCPFRNIYNSTCYRTHSEKVNWFTAVNRCLSKGGSLAVFDDNILTYFASTLLKDYGDIWIGLIKSWWTWPDGGLY